MAPSEEAPRAVRAAFEVLLAVSNAGTLGQNVHDLCRGTGLHKRTVYRHLSTLRDLGMVQPAEEPGRYRLGPVAAGLAVRGSHQRAFLRRAQLFADEVTERTRQPAHVTVYDHGTSVTVASASAAVAESTRTVPIVLGSRRPAHASASGKVFLAHDRSALTGYLTRPLQAFTQHTITDPDILIRQCQQIRRQGWASESQENLPGVSCVAVPVRGEHLRVLGALVISTQQPTLSDATREELLDGMLPAAAEFSTAIGGDGR